MRDTRLSVPRILIKIQTMKKTIFASIWLSATLSVCTELHCQTVDMPMLDMTDRIVNNDFENDYEGWTIDAPGQKISTTEKADGLISGGQKHLQLWVGSGGINGKVYQKLSGLPEGKYILTAIIAPSFSGNVSLYAGNDETPIQSGSSKVYDIAGETHDGSMEIGIKLSTSGSPTIDMDDFRLYYTGGNAEGYKIMLDAKAEEARNVVSEIAKGENVPGYNNLAQLLDAVGKAESADENSEDELLEAINAVDDAIEVYKGIVNDYLPLFEAHDKLLDGLEASDYPKDEMGILLQAAEELLNDKEDRRGDIDGMISEIDEAYATLELFEKLKDEIDKCTLLLNDSEYDGKEEFAEVINEASEIYASPAGKDLASALEALNAAYEKYLEGRPSEWVTVKNGALYKDDRGEWVQAHGAGFIYVGDTWYMIGEDRSRTWNPDVNMYSSKNLVDWKYEGKIIDGSTHSALADGSRFIERPKIMYCKHTGQYVIWCHWEQGNYGASEAAVFYSDNITGPYKFHWAGRPLGIKSRDCNVFVDEDGTAYFISTTNENRDLGLFKLSEDYLDAVEHTALFKGQGREAPAIVKAEGKYFMLSSACSGWDPNQCKVAWSNSLESGWSGLSNIGNGIAFDTQAASILTINGTNGTSYLYVGDRWQDPNLAESKTIVFPIAFSGNSCVFKYRQKFDINLKEGVWKESDDSDCCTDKSKWKIMACSSEETGSEDGRAENIFDNDASTIWHTRYSGNKAMPPHSVEVDMGEVVEISGFRCIPRTDDSTNGLIRQYIFYVSTDGKKWESVSGGSWMPYGAEIHFSPVDARYFRLVSLEGDYASIAELDILNKPETYMKNEISSNFRINSDEWKSGKFVWANKGDDVSFRCNVDEIGGSWAFAGPNGHMTSGYEYTCTGIAEDDAGTYTAMYLNPANQTSTFDFSLKLKEADTSIEAAGDAESRQIASRRIFNLQGIEVDEMHEGGLYIIKETYSDGNTRTYKILK